MKILALDTATEGCSAALLIGGQITGRELELGRGHAEHILPMIDALLAEGGMSLGALDAIAFGRGPGGFTGVRLAASVTQGLAFGAGLPVVPVSDLRAVAQRALGLGAASTESTAPVSGEYPPMGRDNPANRVIVCNDARMREVYWACFELDQSSSLATLQGDEHVSKPTDVRLPPEWTPTTILAAGRGFRAYAEALQTAVPIPNLSAALTGILPRATEIALLSVPEVAAGRLHPPEAATPVYLRDNVAHVAQPPKPST
jgi:tRNA threonylcarbamoyladenosine biosynthesis protein TsaB